MRYWIVGLFILLFSTVSEVSAAECAACGDDCGCEAVCACNHEPRAPIGVMGDHVHHKGAWMTSYRYMFMNMDRTDSDVSGYMMRPLSMDMQMHMLGAMYTPMNDLTIGLMLPYLINDMDMEMGAMSMPMEMNSEGFGDLKLSGIYRLWSSSVQQLLVNLAVSFPTGSIDEESGGSRLPYSMQLGSGSYGLIPGITYTGLANGWGWGGQLNGTFYLNENDNDYTLGDRYGVNIWGARDLCKSSAVSLRLKGSRIENIDGADPEFTPMMIANNPLMDPNLRAGTRLDLLAGIDYRWNTVRLALEGGAPVYEELDGPQLETQWMVIGGLQLSF
ncbi:transporter [Pontiella agarivorans]|uniref:Transporter n=1 Tax=Pontiella agarivorans TaxID=3038953 RepID=A0ABU5MVN1_9BACT|nr:transporter [Pontiella agarivorans]MDZ8118230.1 transporter [Pontiella agarivorans]